MSRVRDGLRRLLRHRRPIVLGDELASGQRADAAHHARAAREPSPLVGISYDGGHGDYDLFRLVPSPVDAQVRHVVAEADAGRVPALRDRLGMDDFYTLLAFVRRSVLQALRTADATPLDDALRALVLLDHERMDWRDAVVNVELVAWALDRLGADHQAPLTAAMPHATSGIADVLGSVASRPRDGLSPGMWAAIATPDGPALADSDLEPYAPTVDLVDIAWRIRQVVERDVYRVESFQVACDIPEVWLLEDAARERALSRLRAVVGLRGGLPADDAEGAQMLLVFVAEAHAPDDASLIAKLARSRGDREVTGVAVGNLCVVLIASSTVAGVPNTESVGTLDRFREDVGTLLERAA